MPLLATHVGSLPRSQEVVDFIFARERNEPYDPAAFDACMTAAVRENVRRQKEAGIDIVSDGEASKISYATYVKDRYTGFDGDSPRNAPADLKLFPSFLERLAKDGGSPRYARPQCVGPVVSKGQGELQKDIANLTSAMAAEGVERGFMNAASPGVISLFLQNAHYKTREDYLFALADAMREEYRTILDAGLDLQLDCPDLALSRHMVRPLPDGGFTLHYDPAIAVPFRTLTPEAAAEGEQALWQLYDRIAARTLLTRGADSDLLSRSTALAMTTRGPRASLVEFPGVGHAPTFVAPDQIDVVASFLLRPGEP